MKADTFGERLAWARKRYAKLTQAELRDKMMEDYEIPIGRNYISELELDKDKRVSFAVVRAMAGTLKVSTDFLALFTEDPTPSQKEVAATYFSEEADEVAQLVDRMRPEQRAIVVNVARGLLPATQTEQTHANLAAKNLAGWRAASEVLEERFGPDGAEEYLSLLETRSPEIAAALRLSASKKKFVKDS